MFKAANCVGLKALAMIGQQSRYVSRSLFTANALGMTKLDQLRSQKSQMFAGESRQRYIERLSNYLDSNDSTSIFKDDLANMVGIAEGVSDLELLEQMLENSTKEQRTFFQGWGTAIMRLYYKMNLLDRAVTNIRDLDRFGDYFDKRSCYKIVMTMLYDSGEYQKVLDLYRLYQERLKDTPLAKAYAEKTGEDALPDGDLTLLTFAALAKLNTPQALTEAKSLISSRNDKGKNIGIRPISMVAYMAMMNGDINYALNLISSNPRRNYVSLRDTKILALLRAGRHDDVILQLRDYATSSKLPQHRLLKTTFEELDKAKNGIQDVAIKQELDDILIEIREGKYVSDETLEGIIFRPIDYERQSIRPRDDNDTFRDRSQGFREFERDRRPFRRDRDTDNHRHQTRDEGRDSSDSRRERRGDSQRTDRRFSFQNVNFES